MQVTLAVFECVCICGYDDIINGKILQKGQTRGALSSAWTSRLTQSFGDLA